MPSGEETEETDTDGENDIHEIVASDSKDSEDNLPLSAFVYANQLRGSNVTWTVDNIYKRRSPYDFQSQFGLANGV